MKAWQASKVETNRIHKLRENDPVNPQLFLDGLNAQLTQNHLYIKAFPSDQPVISAASLIDSILMFAPEKLFESIGHITFFLINDVNCFLFF